MHHRPKVKCPKVYVPPPVRWESKLTIWAGAVGMFIGFVEEAVFEGNSMLWMSGGAIGGALVGAICESAIYLFRRLRRKRVVAQIGSQKTKE